MRDQLYEDIRMELIRITVPRKLGRSVWLEGIVENFHGDLYAPSLRQLPLTF